MNITVRVSDGRDHDHTEITGWTVETDGSLWIRKGDEPEAVYAHGHWQWVDKFPVPAQGPEATPPCCTPDRPHPTAPEAER